jgi:hypothetical protein
MVKGRGHNLTGPQDVVVIFSMRNCYFAITRHSLTGSQDVVIMVSFESPLSCYFILVIPNLIRPRVVTLRGEGPLHTTSEIA